MKEYTITFTAEITIVGKMPEECNKTPLDFPKEKYEEAFKKGVLTAKDFDDLKVTKMQVFDTTRQTNMEKLEEWGEKVLKTFRKVTEEITSEEDAVGLTD